MKNRKNFDSVKKYNVRSPKIVAEDPHKRESIFSKESWISWRKNVFHLVAEGGVRPSLKIRCLSDRRRYLSRHVACAVFAQGMLCTDSSIQRCKGKRGDRMETPDRKDRSTFSVAITMIAPYQIWKPELFFRERSDCSDHKKNKFVSKMKFWQNATMFFRKGSSVRKCVEFKSVSLFVLMSLSKVVITAHVCNYCHSIPQKQLVLQTWFACYIGVKL